MDDLFEHLGTGTHGIGYRLDRLEVYNWGTFDSKKNTVHSVQLSGATALLVGQNGTGKSTLVDALLTLLVRPHVRNYNVAAGAKKRERDERSYVKGAHGRLSRSNDNGTQVEYLRPDNKHYSVVLACFRNEATEAFTVAQVLYLNSEGGVEKVYCFAEDERSISKDCGGLLGTERIRRQMEERGFRATDKYTEYHRWIERKTGMLPKAMDMFNQTVAVKDIQSLNEFIREHMLEATDWRERIDSLQGHFEQLTEAHRTLVLVRRQHELLVPIATLGEIYREKAAMLLHLELLSDACESFILTRRIEFLEPTIVGFATTINAIKAEKLRLEEEAALAQEETRGIKNELEQSGGQRLRDIPLLIRTHEASAESRRAAAGRLHGLMAAAGLAETIMSASGLESLLARVPKLIAELDEKLAVLGKERDKANLAIAELQRLLDDDRRELQALSTRQSKLPEGLAAIRRAICEELGLRESDLPYAAELIAIASEEKEWEASAELVLGGFARSLLVASRYYGIVSARINRVHLRDERGKGMRLEYLRVTDRQARPSPSASTNTLLRKLKLKPDHPLVPWLRAELQDRFNYQCCENVEDFQAAAGPAMTKERHVKSANGVRHQKDDRDRATDPRFFVLGWDNRDKRLLLAAEVKQMEGELAQFEADLKRLNTAVTESASKKNVLQQIQEFVSWDAIDYRSQEILIDALQEEKHKLEAGNDTLKVLKARLKASQDREASLIRQRDEKIGHETLLGHHVDQAQRLAANARSVLEQIKVQGKLAIYARVFDQLQERLGSVVWTLETLVEAGDRFCKATRESADTARQALDPVREQVCKLMNHFLREFKEESNLDGQIDYLPEFCAMHERIVKDDLPRHEQRFKDRLNENVLREVGFLHAEFDTERADIVEKIGLLNSCLSQLDYGVGTKMRLDPRPVRDVVINEFQRELRECLSGTFEHSGEADEARYVRIAKLLEKLRDDDAWRVKVTDVRRWFDFAAIEYDTHTQTEKHCYTDGSGQSGGEKAKLAFTILVAAIAYQYDIDPSRPMSNRFHFVVVDEMFSKVDDRYAEYALELFKRFGLQLLIVAPLDAKARVTEPYAGCYLHVSKDPHTDLSEVVPITAEEFEAQLVSTPLS